MVCSLLRRVSGFGFGFGYGFLFSVFLGLGFVLGVADVLGSRFVRALCIPIMYVLALTQGFCRHIETT